MFFNRKITYFISYAHEKGFGRVDITTNKKVKNIADLKRIEDHIKNAYKLHNVVILNYQVLK